MKKFWKTIVAYTTDRWVWRIQYDDGRKTHPLTHGEAASVQSVYGGALYIDYEKGLW